MRARSALVGLLGVRLGSAAAEVLERGVLPQMPSTSARSALEEAAASVLSALDRLAPTEQQRLLGAVACARAAGDAVLQAACGEYDHLAPVAHRALAGYGYGSSSGSSSGSGGSGSGGGDCPYKDDAHHAANREHIELMVVAVIMITVVFEVVTHALDHYAAHQPHIFQIVQRVYKELMLLGIISFGLFFFEASFCLPPEFTHELHVIHILIFFISIAYIAEAIFILYVAGAVARRWTKIESISLMQYAALKLQLAAYTQKLAARNVVVRSCSWLLLYKQHVVRGHAAYQDARLQFVSCNRLPHDFNFALYLRRCIRTTFVDLLHIHWGIWLAVAMLVQLDVFLLTNFINPTRTSLEATGGLEFVDYCMVGGIVLTLWLGVIYWKVLQVQEKCFKSDLMEFNVWEELMWMMQQQRLQKLQGEHTKGKRFIGKVKKKGPAVAPPPAPGEPAKRTTKRSSLMPFGKPKAGGDDADGEAPGASSRASRKKSARKSTAPADEDALLAAVSAEAKLKDGQFVQQVQAKRVDQSIRSGTPPGERAGGGGAGASPDPTVPRMSMRRSRPPIGGAGANGAAAGGSPAGERAGGSPAGSPAGGGGGGGGGGGMNLRKGSIVIGNKAAITPQEYLEHVDAVRTAWRYAITQTIHDIRLAKRMKKQKKYGHFSIEQWGRTSRVFEKFFWFHSHYFIQYFLQGAVFCTSIYFALLMNFGQTYLFTEYNFEHKLPQLIVLITSVVLVVLLGLFTFVPAILMQYTMVMHLAQTYEKTVVNEAVAAAKHTPIHHAKAHAAHGKEGGGGKPGARTSFQMGGSAGGGGHHGMPSHGHEEHSHLPREPLRTRLRRLATRDGFEAFINSTPLMHFFLTLLLIDFFISVMASVVRQDQADFCVAHCIGLCLDPTAVVGLPDVFVDAMRACVAAGQNTSGVALETDLLNFGSVAHTLESTDIALAYIFVVEVAARLLPDPRAFATSPWDVFDAVVVVTYAVAAPLMTAGGGSGLIALRVLRVLRFHRFLYAMSASGGAAMGGPTRRERLVMCCKKMVVCCSKHDGGSDAAAAGMDFAPPPRGMGDLGDDPIAAMKAKRAAARANGGAEGGGATPGMRTGNRKTTDNVVSPAEVANCSA